MPVYEFRCGDCGNEFQDLFFSSDIVIEEVECPSCGARRAERLMSLFASDVKSSGGDSVTAQRSAGRSCSASSCAPGCRCH